jgi:capsular polysaccharide transport system permease protein
MTTKPTIKRFRIRRGPEADTPGAPAPRAGGQTAGQPAAAHPPVAQPSVAQPPVAQPAQAAPAPAPPAQATTAQGPDTAARHSAPGGTPAHDTAPPDPEAERAAIRAEGLTGRQLRMARRVAQRQGIAAETEIDAVRLLRRAGIDPFQRTTMLDLVVSDAGKPVTAPTEATGSGLPGTLPAAPGGGVPNLPARTEPARPPSTEVAQPPRLPRSDVQDIRDIQLDIARRRRRRLALLATRLTVFVLLPTLIVAWFYYFVATPLYTTQSEFIIQTADAPASPGGIGGLLSGTAMATSQDSVTVQSYLQSREAMRRLDDDLGFRAHFSADGLDPLLQLPPDATLEAAYRLYQRVVKIGYDPTEGLIRLEVRATEPETSAAFSRALISYAEEQVDQMTQRLRADQMEGAMQGLDDAERRMTDARERVIDLQERFRVLSSDVEVSMLTSQISTLETELTRERLSLQELLSNPRPNPARVDPLQRRIAALEDEIASLRSRLTQGGAEGVSLARISSELIMAEADVQTRQLMLSQAMQQLESARIEANRQVRYLSLGVNPVAPDEASHPRAFENSILAFLVFAGIYLMVSMTGAILREQVSA